MRMNQDRYCFICERWTDHVSASCKDRRHNFSAMFRAFVRRFR